MAAPPRTPARANTASPDDVKQAASPAPQAAATGNMPTPKPADAGNNNLPVIPGAAPQNQPGQANTALTQSVQVSTSGPNVPALAVEIAARSQSGAKQFDIRLDPPELGRVEIRLSIDATGKASAHVSADQPQTLDLLQKDAPTLTRALRDAGLNVSQNGLNFSLRQQQGDAGASGNQNRGGNGRSFTLAAVSNIDATPAGASLSRPRRRPARHQGLRKTHMTIGTATTTPTTTPPPTTSTTGSSGTATNANGSTTGSSAFNQLSGNFQTFLTLLTTQLKNQDPTSPMDSNQFTQQLVEYSQVEQQINTNTNLQTLISQGTSNASAMTMGYLGKNVSITNGNASLTNGTANWTYNLGTAAAEHDAHRHQFRRHGGLYRRRLRQCGQQHLHLERPGQ